MSSDAEVRGRGSKDALGAFRQDALSPPEWDVSLVIRW